MRGAIEVWSRWETCLDTFAEKSETPVIVEVLDVIVACC